MEFSRGAAALGAVRANSRGLAGSLRRPEAAAPPFTYPFPHCPQQGTGGWGSEARPARADGDSADSVPGPARGARTSQEMGPCASLSVSREQAGHRNEPHPLPRGPQAPRKRSSRNVTRAEPSGPRAVPAALWPSPQRGRGTPWEP